MLLGRQMLPPMKKPTVGLVGFFIPQISRLTGVHELMPPHLYRDGVRLMIRRDVKVHETNHPWRLAIKTAFPVSRRHVHTSEQSHHEAVERIGKTVQFLTPVRKHKLSINSSRLSVEAFKLLQQVPPDRFGGHVQEI